MEVPRRPRVRTVDVLAPQRRGMSVENASSVSMKVVPGESGARDLVVKRQLQARDLTAMTRCLELLIGRVVMKRELLRRRYRVLLLAALVVGLTVPLGFALSVPSSPTPSVEGRNEGIASSVVMSGPLRLPSSGAATEAPH